MDETTPEAALWQRTLEILERDSRITGSMMGFAALAEVKGIIGETIYLEVPNDLTRSMFEQRMRDLLGLTIGDGTEQIMKMVIARKKGL